MLWLCKRNAGVPFFTLRENNNPYPHSSFIQTTSSTVIWSQTICSLYPFLPKEVTLGQNYLTLEHPRIPSGQIQRRNKSGLLYSLHLKYFGFLLYLSFQLLFPFQVISGEKYGKKCDVYSFGMTAWSIDAEEYPFTTVKSEFLLYNKIVNGERPKLLPNCKMNDIIQKCWDNVFDLFCLTLFCSVSFIRFNILLFIIESRHQARIWWDNQDIKWINRPQWINY